MFLPQAGVLLHPGAETGVHVLDRPDPHAHHPGADVTEVFPGQRGGAERVGTRARGRPARGDRRRAGPGGCRRGCAHDWTPPGSAPKIMVTTLVVYYPGARVRACRRRGRHHQRCRCRSTEPPPTLARVDRERSERGSGALEAAGSADAAGPAPRFPASLQDAAEWLRNGNHHPGVIALIRRARRALPGDPEFGDPLSTAGEGGPRAAARAADRLLRDRTAASREVSLGALQVWQAVTEMVARRPRDSQVTLVFTDLVGFSSWSLRAGDDATLTLLRRVAQAIEPPLLDSGGASSNGWATAPWRSSATRWSRCGRCSAPRSSSATSTSTATPRGCASGSTPGARNGWARTGSAWTSTSPPG